MPSNARFLLGGFLIAVCAMLLVLALAGGAPTPEPAGLPDPGPVVGWGVSLAKLAADFAAVGTVGFLLLAGFLLPSTGSDAEGLAVDAVRIARRAALVWAGATLALFVLVTANSAGVPLHELGSGLLWSMVTDTSLGRLIVAQAIAAAVIATALRWTLSVRAIAAWLGAAVASLAFIAFTGHSAVAGAHDVATMSLFLHLGAITLWVGGLVALGWLATRGSRRFEAARGRYATLASWCFVVVGVSGLANAMIRLSGFDMLFSTDYGRVVLAKVLAYALIGSIAWAQRRRSGSFGLLAVVELLTMGATFGIAVGLSLTPPASQRGLITPAENLLGGPLPPAPTPWRMLTGTAPAGVGLAVVGLGAALYLAGVLALLRRGDRWPRGRTISWFAGLVVIGWATFGGLGLYSHVMFSAHMVAHMMLSMVAPILLVLGAPMTLALRSLPGPRVPGEVSPRAMLVAILHSRITRFLTFPAVGPAIFVGSLYALYFTPLFEQLMRGEWGHGFMELHFIVAGSLFYYVIVGVDPAPRALPPIARFGVLMITIPFHAFFAIAVMSSKTVFAETYWRIINRPYATDLLHDQYLGGSIAWAMGELPLVVVMGALFVQWIRSDSREARRLDRAADRDDDAALRAYNDRLQAMHERKTP
jgi:putative copper resistance protein D